MRRSAAAPAGLARRGWRGGAPADAAAVAVLVALLCLACLTFGAWLAWHHPLAPRAVLVAFFAWSVVVAWRPGLWLFVVPAVLPCMNFAPWTGWIVVEEFDLLVLGVAVGGYARWAATLAAAWPVAARQPGSPWRTAFVGAALLFGLATLVGLGRGVWAAGDLGPPASGWFQGYSDALNSWRVFKSVAWAALLWPLLRREVRFDRDGAVRRLATGMCAGLTIVTLAVVWERAAYPGLWDFALPYRTTALFWEMHVGGAAIDAYLALATPFVAWALWSARSQLRWGGAAMLALLTGYACLTTFSRGVYFAVAAPLALLVFVLGVRAASKQGNVRVRSVVLALALLLEAAVVLGLGTFMRERIGTADRDLGSRLAHWRNGLGLMRNPADWVWGIGSGRLPGAYAAQVAGGEFPGAVELVPGSSPGAGQAGQATVTLLGPKTRADLNGLLALTQRIALHPGRGHRVEFDVRAAAPAEVYLRVCEMHLLYPRECQRGFVRITAGPAPWRHLSMPMQGRSLTIGNPWLPRLAVFSIAVVNAGGAAEFANLSLHAPDGAELLVNGDFSQGLAHWLPAARGYFVPWHIDNLYLELLIERGLPAALVFAACLGMAVWRPLRQATRAAPIAPFVVASLCGAMCVGLVSSVLDAPRVAFLMLFLMIFAVELTEGRER